MKSKPRRRFGQSSNAPVSNIQQTLEVDADAFDDDIQLSDEEFDGREEALREQHEQRKGYFAGMREAMKTSEELQLEKDPIQVRETGFLFWKRVIVPPNAYVVHTRLGREAPVTIGLGKSFRYNPTTDAYLIVPAAMQTIGIVANCITSEKQGINVLAYVQWQISNFAIAYRKLDFSDSRDPLNIVNAQLREQAEAAIKDKISTMTVEEVLTDKAPVIEELTRRLIEVSEGRLQRDDGTGDAEGLGISIVTVQIKEAFVSSTQLWENLQAPFRHEQQKSARLSYLEMQEEIRTRELDTRRTREISEAETRVEIERIKQTRETEEQETRLEEEEKRFAREQTTARQKIQLEEETTLAEEESARRLEQERARQEQEVYLQRMQREQEQSLEKSRREAETSAKQTALKIEGEIREMEEKARLEALKAADEQARFERETQIKQAYYAYQQLTSDLQIQLDQAHLQAELEKERQKSTVDIELETARSELDYMQREQATRIARIEQEIRNLISDGDLQQRLIEKLPEVAGQMPDIQEMRVIQSGTGASPTMTLLTELLTIFETMRDSLVHNNQNGNSEA